MLTTRLKFNAELSGYNRKKYVAKLLYIHMLGHDVSVGHVEAVNLLKSQKYSEKYMVIATFA